MHRYVLIAALSFLPLSGCAKSEPAPEGEAAPACETCEGECQCEGAGEGQG
jgi:hypothetical protein